VLAARVRLFEEAAGDGSTVAPWVREAVLMARGRAQLAVVSGAARGEVESVLQTAGLDVFDVVVVATDVTRGKPAPDIYLRALDLLDVNAADAAAIEDATPGVAAAKAAGST
jgi:HAD superfamily hydrolase (TIGR01509 family)